MPIAAVVVDDEDLVRDAGRRAARAYRSRTVGRDAALLVVGGDDDRQQARHAVGFPLRERPHFERHQRLRGARGALGHLAVDLLDRPLERVGRAPSPG